jgi:two-component system, OmpR family, response regulator RegX3
VFQSCSQRIQTLPLTSEPNGEGHDVGPDIKVLVVGEDQDGAVSTILREEGWVVSTSTGTEAVSAVETQRPDLVVLHVQRFGLGLEVCSAVRSCSRVAVMIVSRSSAEEDLVAGLRRGADAIVVEGVGGREFVARARALLRRVPPSRTRDPVDVLRVGAIVLNPGARQVTVNDELLALPRREFDILEVLMRDADRIVSREALRRRLWGTSRDSRTLDVQVRRLRTRLVIAEGCRRIITIRGVGYRFASVAEPLSAPDPGHDLDASGNGTSNGTRNGNGCDRPGPIATPAAPS